MIGSLNKLIATILALSLSLTHATLTLAQSSPDTRSPVIELEAVAEAEAEQTQVFTAQVADNRIIKDVILYYRREGQQAFTPVPMSAIADSGYYTVSIETDPTDLRAIQYYVQARDEGGNRTVEGYAFDPYTRVLIENKTVISTAPAVVADTPATSGGVRWWQVALGVVLVGAVVGAASSGGSSSSGEGGVPLSVTLTGLQ